MKKTVPLTVRRRPAKVHQAFKKSARVNNRSTNGEALAWLARGASSKPVTGREAVAILRRAQKILSLEDRKAIAKGIEKARRKMEAQFSAACMVQNTLRAYQEMLNKSHTD